MKTPTLKMDWETGLKVTVQNCVSADDEIEIDELHRMMEDDDFDSEEEISDRLGE